MPLVQDLDDADDLARRSSHGRRQDRDGVEAGACIRAGIEASVVVGVRDVDDLAGRRDRAGDSPARREPDR